MDNRQGGASVISRHTIDGKPWFVAADACRALYKLILRSDKPQAKPFQDWVTKVVLLTVRKDGGYLAGEEKLASGEISEEEFVLRGRETVAKCSHCTDGMIGAVVLHSD